MTNQALAAGKADVIQRVVARCIKDKMWRSECIKEALAFATKAERGAVKAYVEAEYLLAGAGFSGRWQ